MILDLSRLVLQRKVFVLQLLTPKSSCQKKFFSSNFRHILKRINFLGKLFFLNFWVDDSREEKHFLNTFLFMNFLHFFLSFPSPFSTVSRFMKFFLRHLFCVLREGNKNNTKKRKEYFS